jgi:hypothetical protein
VDQRLARAISAACNETMKRLNAPGSAIQKVNRINEVSSHFQDMLREPLNAAPGLRCDFPLTAERKVQRSGSPDLRIGRSEEQARLLFRPKTLRCRKPRQQFPGVLFRAKKIHEQSARRRGAFRGGI